MRAFVTNPERNIRKQVRGREVRRWSVLEITLVCGGVRTNLYPLAATNYDNAWLDSESFSNGTLTNPSIIKESLLTYICRFIIVPIAPPLNIGIP